MDPTIVQSKFVTVELASTIMGSNFLGRVVTEYHFGMMITAEQKKVLATVPFSAEVLEECKETHILVACAGLSLLDVWQACNGLFYIRNNVWYQQQRWATIKVLAGWYLVRKSPVLDSTSKTWHKQQKLLGLDEQVPSAAVLAQAILLTFLVTEERLFRTIYVCSSDVGSDGGRLCLGFFGQNGLRIRDCWDSDRYDYIGLASSMKSS